MRPVKLHPIVVDSLPQMAGWRVHRCPMCEHPFLTRSTKQVFCHPICRKLAWKTPQQIGKSLARVRAQRTKKEG